MGVFGEGFATANNAAASTAQTAAENFSRSLTTTLTTVITPGAKARICEVGGDGIFLPFSDSEGGKAPQIGRGLLYVVFMGWIFLGVAISSDVFMSGIEQITSQRKRVKHPLDPNRMVTVAVWNDTIANLTLMAFGSSTPEILLSIIELVSREYFTGELGANTIVGSASFNLLIIIGLCISSIPSTEVRIIKEWTVYIITAFFSIFAYIWLFIVLQVISPNKVEIWEGFATFLLFPLLLIISYIADVGYFTRSKGGDSRRKTTPHLLSTDLGSEDIDEYAAHIRKKFGKDLPDEKILRMLEAELKPKKTKASHRHGALAMLTGAKGTKGHTKIGAYEEGADVENGEGGAHHGGSMASKMVDRMSHMNPMTHKAAGPEIYWDLPDNELMCLECVGTIKLPVVCLSSNKRAKVWYTCRPGTAKDKTEYHHVEGCLEFGPSTEDQTQWVEIRIQDDDIQEDDMDFFVDLKADAEFPAEIIGPECRVLIIDDDEPGVLQWHAEAESVRGGNSVDLKVLRRKGGSGKLTFKVSTEAGSAKPGVDFNAVEEEEFSLEHEQLECTIPITLRTDGARVRVGMHFRVVLSEPNGGASINPDTDGGEESCICTITFGSPDENTRAKFVKAKSMIANNWEAAKFGSENYASQFEQAIYCNGSKEDQKESSWTDMLLHFITLPWKALAALVPPPIYMNGWLTFVGALAVIGLQTAILSDIAEMVGCCFDFPDSVTAITLVALGTSLPDTFASLKAAKEDEYADSSVTNVTGSNSVNVFLGLGLPWIIGSIHWSSGMGSGECDLPKQFGGQNCDRPEKYQQWAMRILSMEKIKAKEIWIDNKDGGLIHFGEELGFSVLVYSCLALCALSVLHWRRKKIGGEFGGPAGIKKASSAVFAMGWVIYVSLSSWWAIKEQNAYVDWKKTQR